MTYAELKNLWRLLSLRPRPRQHLYESRNEAFLEFVSGKMAQKKTAEVRSIENVLEKRLEKDELEEVYRLLYGKAIG